MKVSAVICTYSIARFSNLMEAIQSLVEQTYKNIEIIVVVDHNTPLYEKLKSGFRENTFRILHNQDVKGLSGSKNYGLDAASGKIIAFLDDDAVASKDWIEQMLKSYKESEVAAVGGLTLPQWEHKKPPWFPEEFYWVLGCTYKGHVEKTAVVRNVFGGNCSFRKNCMDKTGRFLPCIGLVGKKMLTGEETEYCMRIQKIMPSRKIIFNPYAVIYHKVPKQKTTLKYFIRRAFGSGYSSAIIHKLLPGDKLKTERGFLWHIFFNFIPRTLVTFPKQPFTAVGQLSVAFIGIIFTGLGYIAGKGINVQRK
ncbi:MAG TPA: glycosyltransferase family 2 protein [Thermoanaerobacterales bacterium]|jgi:glycosyltransferase involved in cell wall biosynthesis|nr:glycosyltransferase family 2 protein [Thermoanaerobacterales bacterium]